ncbi:hypothetical protein [Halocatena salina]|uniref:Uncharacterized protein n=1 Tax=Halocatena salina TaxID=2934340 RepID=A0A8U0A3L7_9EURY|nr:hypothetical protein [Halocatena salina]UPM43795.1 hypothetical protein MW046_04950 [Halocatena salina]
MDRRSYLKGIGMAAGGAIAGGLGVQFLSDSVAGATVDISGPTVVESENGAVAYVAFSGELTYNWDDVNSTVTHGRAVFSSRLLRNGTEIMSKTWQEETFAIDEGMRELSRYGYIETPDDFSSVPVGGTYSIKSTGTYSGIETSHRRPICVIAENGWVSESSPTSNGYIDSSNYDDPSGLPRSGGYVVVDDPYSTDHFGVSTNGGSQTTTVELTFKGEIYNGDPTTADATQLSTPGTATGRFDVRVENKVTSGTSAITGNGIAVAEHPVEP